MVWTNKKTPQQRLVRNQQLLFDGDLKGRIRTVQVGSAPTSYQDSEDGEYEDGSGVDCRFANDKFVVSGVGTQSLTLVYVPTTNSEHVYWQPTDGAGLYLEEGPDWAKTGDNTLVVNGNLLEVGDTLVVEYSYNDLSNG